MGYAGRWVVKGADGHDIGARNTNENENENDLCFLLPMITRLAIRMFGNHRSIN